MSDIRRAAFFIAPALHRPTLPTGFFALAISDCPAIDRDISNLRGYPCILRIASLCNHLCPYPTFVLGVAYPKGTSKKYSCDFNRDDGWEVLRQAGFDSVRQVAIDDRKRWSNSTSSLRVSFRWRIISCCPALCI